MATVGSLRLRARPSNVFGPRVKFDEGNCGFSSFYFGRWGQGRFNKFLRIRKAPNIRQITDPTSHHLYLVEFLGMIMGSWYVRFSPYMLPGGSRISCMIQHMVPGLGLYFRNEMGKTTKIAISSHNYCFGVFFPLHYFLFKERICIWINRHRHTDTQLKYSGYHDSREVPSGPKIPPSTSLISYANSKEFLSWVGDSAELTIFHHDMRGARVESTLGWNSTLLRHINAWLQTSPCSAEDSSSSKTRGVHLIERHVEPDVREGLGKHGKTTLISFLFRPICSLITVLLS